MTGYAAALVAFVIWCAGITVAWAFVRGAENLRRARGQRGEW